MMAKDKNLMEGDDEHGRLYEQRRSYGTRVVDEKNDTANGNKSRPRGEDATPPNRSCRRPYLVEVPMFLYFLAYKACLPLQEQFVFSLITISYTEEYEFLNAGQISMSSNCDIPFDQDESSRLLCYLNMSRTIPALITTLLILAYTDNMGRKLGLLFPCITGVIKSFVFVSVIYFRASYYWLFIGTFIEGVGGSHMVMQSSSYAYIADIAPLSRRSFRFAVVQGVLYAATAAGNLGVGYCLLLGYANSFAMIGVVYAVALGYVAVALPESLALPGNGRSGGGAFSLADVFSKALHAFDVYRLPDVSFTPGVPPAEGRDDTLGKKIDVGGGVEGRMVPRDQCFEIDDIATHNKHVERILNLRLLLIIFCCDAMILYGRNDVDILYMMGQPFCWDSITIGYFQALKYILKAFYALAMVPLLQIWFSDACMGTIACLSGLTGNLIMGLANSSALLWFVPEVSMMSAVVTPLAEAMMSKMVSPEHQGALFASIGVSEALSSLISTSAFNLIYSATVYWLSGFVFILFASLYLLSAFIYIYFCIRISFFKTADEKLKEICE